jgi:uncharacterized membrane protein
VEIHADLNAAADPSSATRSNPRLPTPLDVAQRNISAITSIEQEALESRTSGERLGDAIARSAGRMWFIGLHAFGFAAWVVVNSRLVPGVRAFDPYPFQFLTLVTSLEAIFLSLFILMSQNRAGRQAEVREHLNLQVDLLAEQESTKILQLLQSLCRHHGLPITSDKELRNLLNRTEPGELLRELKENLPET